MPGNRVDLDVWMNQIERDIEIAKRAILSNVPQRVSALPLNPIDGQECYFVPNPSIDKYDGVVWHLRYSASSPSPYKWEFIGGGDTVVNGDPASGQAVAANTITVPNVPMNLTVPLKGEYVVGHNGQVLISGADSIFNVHIYDNTTNAMIFNPGMTQHNGWYGWISGQRKVSFSSPTSVGIRLYSSTAINMWYYRASMFLRPIRVA